MNLQAKQYQVRFSQPFPIATGRHIHLDGELYYRISNSHTMAPFFMTLVSASDHWLFTASNGAVTMGRRDSNNAIFPYYSSDKLIDLVRSSGPLTVLRIDSPPEPQSWLPFQTPLATGNTVQNLYKNLLGSKILFEEVHLELGLTFRYRWETSEKFGFVRTCELLNQGQYPANLEVIDGFQNILPYGVEEEFQRRYSNLVDAYKKCELTSETNLGIFYLSSIPTDHAEPSEGLRCTAVWQMGLERPCVLLSNRQVNAFLCGNDVQSETNLRGQRGAYLVKSSLTLAPGEAHSWTMVADIGLDQTDIIHLSHQISREDLPQRLREDIENGEERLRRFISGADGFQVGELALRTHRHQSNVVFNLMRGGIPVSGYQVPLNDFRNHVRACNRAAALTLNQVLAAVPDSRLPASEIQHRVDSTGDRDLIRITREYLPLGLGRRHGDPTRPWNKFSIVNKGENGEPKLHYEGNWRDLFQNWEALGCSYPQMFNAMILRFVNASTADGYNPYRVTKTGYDWEVIDPADPWANIGYWGDHQIAYLLRLLEWSRRFLPREMNQLLNERLCVYADVPYRIRPYAQLLNDAKATIDFDRDRSNELVNRTNELGSDGTLLVNQTGNRHYVILLEKLVLPAAIKMSNLIPEAGIWLNTQRPEWNDANNALVGHGASVVTVCYLRRYFVFLRDLVSDARRENWLISSEVAELVQKIGKTLDFFRTYLETGFCARSRRAAVDQLQTTGSHYRTQLYDGSFSGEYQSVSTIELFRFFDTCTQYLDQTIDANLRPDGLYHAYNLIRFSSPSPSPDIRHGDTQGELAIERLYEMLEGQVAVINSKKLSAEEVNDVLIALRNSSMYREDLNTYMLYPDRELPEFTDKNLIHPAAASQIRLIQILLNAGNQQIVRRDLNGDLRFNGDFRNSRELAQALTGLRSRHPEWKELIDDELPRLKELFDFTFHHQSFTGRSGTFFGFEGLGCVYWHMISKLLLAAAETYQQAWQDGASRETLAELKSQFLEIRDGLGVSSLPGKYGAFPVDPYSHTPKHAGAQQPGMTGQVKEDILSRWIELGVRVDNGVLSFHPQLFETTELLQNESVFRSFNVRAEPIEIPLASGSFAFSVCQLPIIYQKSSDFKLKIFFTDCQTPVERTEFALSAEESRQVFLREHTIERIELFFH
jgi:hypothetical protein